MYLILSTGQQWNQMTNSWSLLYHTINGTLDEVFPIMYGPEDERNYVAGLSTASHAKWAEFDYTKENVSIDTSNFIPQAEIENRQSIISIMKKKS